jgi:hypothetical protein
MTGGTDRAEAISPQEPARSASVPTRTCGRCGRPFWPRQTGGRAQRFCSFGCRRSFDRAVRAAGRAVVEGEPPTIQLLQNGTSPTRALQQEPEDAASVWRPENQVVTGLDEPVCFLVEVSAATIELLIRGGWLRPSKRDDVLEVLLALRRTSLSATVRRLS